MATSRVTSVMSVGRGRGHINADRRDHLRRPEQKFVNHLDSIATKIAELNMNSQEDLMVIRDEIRNYCVNEAKMKFLVNDLHERSLVNRPFGVKCAAALGTQSHLTVDDKKLRAILMQVVQTDFGDKDAAQAEDISRFMNSVAFLGQVFRHVRLAGKNRIAVLSDALIEYFKMLINGSDFEVELCVQQLAINGKVLRELRDSRMAELQVLIRSASTVPGHDERSLSWLLLACDLDRSNYAPISTELRNFYDDKLGKGAMATISNLLTAPDPITLDDEEDASLALNGLDLNQPVPISPEPVAPKLTSLTNTPRRNMPVVADSYNGHEDSRPQRKSPSHAAPRENNHPPSDPRTSRNPAGEFNRKPSDRGSNRNTQDRKHYPKNDSRNDPANWLPDKQPIPEKDRKAWDLQQRSGGNNSWGHDDRFSREDNYYSSQGRGKTRDENWRAAKGSKDGNRYGQRSFDEPASQPLPSTSNEDSWD